MFSWALTFLVVALVAGLFGFFGVAGTATSAAKILFFVGIVFAVISFVAGRSPRNLG